MKLGIISDLGARDAYIVSGLVHAIPGVKVYKPNYDVVENQSGKKRRQFYRQLRGKVINRIFLNKLHKNKKPKFENVIEISFTKLKNPDGSTIQAFKGLDVLLTCGAPIIPESIFEAPKVCSFNMHHGITEKVRGNNGIYWAIVDGIAEACGGTIHYLSNDLDKGNVIAEFYPEISAMDGETSIESKISFMASREILTFLNYIKTNRLPDGKKQTTRSKNYKASTRDLKSDIKYLNKRFIRKFQGYRQLEKTDRYY